MAKELTDYQTLDELDFKEISRDCIKNKPTVISIIGLLIGVGCMFLSLILAKILGILFIIPSVYILFFVKNETLVEFYDTYLLIYKTKDKALKLQYSSIKEYSVKRSHYGTQAIIFNSKKDDYVYIETFQLKSCKKILEKYLKGKELREEK